LFIATLPFLFVGPQLSWAQTPVRLVETSAPDQKGAVPLYPGKAPDSEGQQQVERWEKWGPLVGVVGGDALIVRNVTQPTLLPFLPKAAKATGAAVIVAPGGGNTMLAYSYEGTEVARWLAEHGVAAFVLKYRLRETPPSSEEFLATPMMVGASRITPPVAAPPASSGATPRPQQWRAGIDDGLAAVRLVRERAAQWKIDPQRVGFVGFSAGAAVTLGVALSADAAERPNFVAPIYGSLAKVDVPADAPPLFTAIGAWDPILARNPDMALVSAWRAAGRPVEAHIYAEVGHGFGMRNMGKTSDHWIDEFLDWMKIMGFLSRGSK
jgi:acetyl esterase/lipase